MNEWNSIQNMFEVVQKHVSVHVYRKNYLNFKHLYFYLNIAKLLEQFRWLKLNVIYIDIEEDKIDKEGCIWWIKPGFCFFKLIKFWSYYRNDLRTIKAY